MTLKTLQKAPFPWFGGKSMAAPLAWELLGDVEHYVEPFAGSLAVLLNRPHVPNRPNYSETVNDLDGLLVNAWRSIQWHPEETAGHASWPVSENDKHARQIALVRWRDAGLVDKLAGSPKWCDTEMAGWWLWGVCVQIGAFAAGGAWTADANGMIVKLDRQENHNRQSGVSRDLPHLSDTGKGLNHGGTKEPGVKRNIPNVSDNGRGVNRPAAREPGVTSDEPGSEFHPHTMPELLRWFSWLSARLRHVRILNGEWHRLVTNGATKILKVRMGDGHVGIFLDPPYADTANRSKGLYGVDDLNVAHVVKAWCANNGNDPDRRIVLAGYDGEHNTELIDLGWTCHEWYRPGFLSGGYAKGSVAGDQQHRERLWASPNCFTPGGNTAADVQLEMFADE